MQALLAAVMRAAAVDFLAVCGLVGAIGLCRHALVPGGVVLGISGLAASRQRGRHRHRHALPAQQQREQPGQ